MLLTTSVWRQSRLAFSSSLLSFLDVRRLIHIDESGEEDEASVKDGVHDYLAKVLIDQVPEICDSSLIKYTSGLATLFKSDRAHRELLPRVFLAWDLRDSSKLVGACNTLRFVCDEAIGTSILTDAYLSKNSLPRFDTQWTLLDIICSRRCTCRNTSRDERVRRRL